MERREKQEELDIEGSCRIFPGDHMEGVFNNILWQLRSKYSFSKGKYRISTRTVIRTGAEIS